MDKVKKASQIKGPAYIHVLQPCATGWGYDPSKTIKLGKLAVNSKAWVLYEIENGVIRVTKKVTNPVPVEEYLSAQKRFKHLKEEQIKVIQEHADTKYAQLEQLSE